MRRKINILSKFSYLRKIPSTWSKYDKISVFSGRLKKLDVKKLDFELGFERRNTQIEHTWPRVKTPLLVKTGQLQLTLPFLSQIKITINFQTG